MKRLQTLLILLLVVFPFCSLAQQFETKLSAWSAKNPIEKLYVHTDREEYFSGQTIWLKGYFMSDFMPSLSSTSLYVELLNHESEVVLKKIFPVYAGTAPGQLDLPDNFSSGQYQLRAYSRVMLNQPGFTFNKRITIHGKENKDAVYEKIFDSN